jgi:hypothetical protein
MTSPNRTEPSFDPRLRKLLHDLKIVPPRDREAEARSRSRFLIEVDELLGEDIPAAAQGGRQNQTHARPKPRFSWTFLQHRLAYSTILAILVITLVLFAGAGATVYAAQVALPGDALYSVKTGLEHTQVTLSRNAAQQAELHLSFAERRLVEIASLIADRRFGDISTATGEFESHVEEAINSLQVVAAGDPAKAIALTARISSALSRYTEILQGMMTSVPDTVKPSIQKALLTSENERSNRVLEIKGIIQAITPEGYLVSGQFVRTSAQTEIKGIIAMGSPVKIQAQLSEDGFYDALEIEVTGGDIINGNANENTNLNENLNENDNFTNMNDNEGENENQGQNDQGNSNGNEDNTNLNGNSHDDHHDGNQNSNEESGGHDDNEQSNDNQHNSNDNHDHEESNQNRNDNGGGGGNENGGDD